MTLRDIEKLHKKPKPDKETRLATAMVTIFVILLFVHTLFEIGLSVH